MNAQIPETEEVRASLLALSHAQMQELARLSSVPFTTLWKVRDGTTKNPGITTVGKFLPLVEKAKSFEPLLLPALQLAGRPVAKEVRGDRVYVVAMPDRREGVERRSSERPTSSNDRRSR